MLPKVLLLNGVVQKKDSSTFLVHLTDDFGDLLTLQMS